MKLTQVPGEAFTPPWDLISEHLYQQSRGGLWRNFIHAFWWMEEEFDEILTLQGGAWAEIDEGGS